MKRALICALSLFIVIFISACEDGKKPQLVTTVTPLADVGPAGGIERITLSHPLVNTVYHVYSKDLESKYLIPEVRSQLGNMRVPEDIHPPNIEPFDSADSPIPNKNLSEITLHGKHLDITEYSHTNAVERVYFAHDDSGLVDIMTYGPRISGELPNGEHSYRGLNLLTITSDQSNSIYEGGFVLEVNFSDQTGEFTRVEVEIEEAEVSRNFAGLEGRFNINLSNGTFTSDEIFFTLFNKDGITMTEIDSIEASIHGSLYGEGASGIAAIYHDNPTENSDSPEYIGVIIGVD